MELKIESNEELVSRVMMKVHRTISQHSRLPPRDASLSIASLNDATYEENDVELVDSITFLNEINRSVELPVRTAERIIYRAVIFQLLDVGRLRSYLGGLR